MKIQWDDWQKEVLDHDGDLLLCTGRRVGKTQVMAAKAVEAMVHKGKDIIIVSITEDQAKIIVAMALNYAIDNYPRLVGKGKHKPQTTKIWVNGNKMESRPVGNTGNSCRGFEGGVLIVDEAAHMPASFWPAAKPVILTTVGQIWMASTPYGKQGYFWEKFNEAYNVHDPQARFKVFYTTTVKVMNERPISECWTAEQKEHALRVLGQEEKEMSKLEFGQEYLGLFMEDLQQFFPDELIKKCQTARRPDHIPYKKYFIGIDVARMGKDQTTFEIGYLTDEGKVIQVENAVTKKTYLFETTNEILSLNSVFNFEKIFIDAEGVGVGVYDALLGNDFTKRKITPLLNSKKVFDSDGKEKGILKTELYNNLRYLMETGQIELLNDDNLFQSLKSVIYEYIGDVDPQIRISGSNTHIAEGLIRLAWAVKYKTLNLWVRSFPI